MSDIIANAQRLLDGATPAPWEWVGYSLEAEHGMVLDFQCVTAFGQAGATREVEATPDDEQLIAAAPELAQALAEETYFYGVQVLMGGRWIMMLTSNYGTSLMHRGKWFERKDEAQACAATWSHDTPTRIVRQRRSPAEVCRTALKPAAAGTTESDK